MSFFVWSSFDDVGCTNRAKDIEDGGRWHYTCRRSKGRCRYGSGRRSKNDFDKSGFVECARKMCEPCARCVESIPAGRKHERICGPAHMERLRQCDSVCGKDVWKKVLAPPYFFYEFKNQVLNGLAFAYKEKGKILKWHLY